MICWASQRLELHIGKISIEQTSSTRTWSIRTQEWSDTRESRCTAPDDSPVAFYAAALLVLTGAENGICAPRAFLGRARHRAEDDRPAFTPCNIVPRSPCGRAMLVLSRIFGI
ncbi:hypothetical protein PsYK624_115850 [Phanerochaete sordida]|uniref:Uncharacterized protein n=1 Tax=Phanerochaete sordida TaxID=48140 RepID=A0A9P3GII0_9APHY|nr:hypothetical protein PsYK624_115850 [Phanerochaete sordida]